MSANSSTTAYKRVLSKGKQDNLPGIEKGMLRFTTDTGRIYLDFDDDKRVEFTDFVKDKTKEQILAIENPLPKVYLATDTHEMLVYDTTSEQWVNYGGGGSGGGLEAVYLTQAEYDALTPQEKADPTKLYLVDDNIVYLTTQDIQFNTTSGWASKSTLVSRLNTIYVYTDYKTKDNKNIPGFKVGDGVTLLINLPFSDELINHAINADTATVANDGIENITRDGTTFTVTRKDGSTFAFVQQDNNTTYTNATTAEAGLLPALDGSVAKFLRGDGNWEIPPDTNVFQKEIDSGEFELLMSNGGIGVDNTGRVNKNTGLTYMPNGAYGQALFLHSKDGVDTEPSIWVHNTFNYAHGWGEYVTIKQNDILLDGTDETGPHCVSWDGTNSSLVRSLKTMHLSGTLTPTNDIGRDGSVYYKIATENNETIIKDIYYKINNAWLKYKPDTTPSPVGDQLLYDWDFRESMIDRVEGKENEPGGGIEDYSWVIPEVHRDDTKGLYIEESWSGSAPMAMIPVDLRLPGYKVEIEFGECEMQYGSDGEYPALIATYYDPQSMEEGQSEALDVKLCWDETYNHPESYPTHTAGGLAIYSFPDYPSIVLDNTVVNTNDENEQGDPFFFANSKFTLITKYHKSNPTVVNPADYQYSSEFYAAINEYEVAWEIYKDDVKVGETPSLVTGFYNSSHQGVPAPVEATYPAIHFDTLSPESIYTGVLFGIPCQAASAGMEIKTLKIYHMGT